MQSFRLVEKCLLKVLKGKNKYVAICLISFDKLEEEQSLKLALGQPLA